MPLFGKGHKSPTEIVRYLRQLFDDIAKCDNEKKLEKLKEDASRNVCNLSHMLNGTVDNEPSPELVAALSQEIYQTNLLLQIICNMNVLDFEAKKDVANIFCCLMRREVGNRQPTVEYMINQEATLFLLMKGYDDPDIAIPCGQMLRECIRHEPLVKIIFDSQNFYSIFDNVQATTFDVASDAFRTFKDLLTKHKIIAADFLDKNYEEIFSRYEALLNSENYVTRRQALKLLGELLLDRHNYNIMTRYISNPDNLKFMMNLLRDKSRNIQFEAFHVFKVFVANPNKPKAISEILMRNQDKLVEFLGGFHSDRSDDEQFTDEKLYLIKQIRELKAVE